MPLIRFQHGQDPVSVPVGANLMKSLLAAGLPVASSCNGDGVCGKCRIVIVEGMENLSAQNVVEQILRERNRIASDTRISCQTQVLGDVTVSASYW